jgi:RHS repeat-associated protein
MTPSRYQFSGQYNESELGLYYYNARWYDGYLNHFTSPDTVIADNYQTLDYDRYAYARSNPVRYTDPSGHKACEDVDEQGECITENEINNYYQREMDKSQDKFHPLGYDSDYYSISIFHGAPGWLLGLAVATASLAEPTSTGELSGLAIAGLVNGGVTVTIDRYGRLFVSPGLSIGLNSVEALPTVTLTAGNLMTGEYKGLPIMEGGTPDEIRTLLTEFSTTHNISYAFFPNVGFTTSPAAPYDAVEFGSGVPAHVGFATFSWGFGPWQILK